MDRQQIGLKLALEALGRELRLREFDERLSLQKTVYLIQAAGVHLGYSFRWYLRGPYSPSLTRDAFSIATEAAQGTDDAKGWKLDPDSLKILTALQPLFRDTPEEALPARLELLASVHFVRKSREGQGNDVPQLHRLLQRYGKSYTEDDIRRAIEELKRHGLTCAPPQ